MKTKVNVYLVKTDKYSIIHKFGDCLDMYADKQKWYGKAKPLYQHLYFTIPQSDLEISKIKEGEWFIRNNELYQCFKSHKNDIEFKTLKESVYCGKNTFWDRKYCEKIIACIDDSLSIKDEDGFHSKWKLPSIPVSFIEHYINEYNEGNIIKEAEIELIDDGHYVDMEGVGGEDVGWYSDIQLRLSDKNEVFVDIPEEEMSSQSEEKMYSRNEVEELCENAYDSGRYSIIEKDVDNTFDNWVKENLK